jgi:hypothetical protein
VHQKVAFIPKLQAPRKVAARAAHAFCYGIDLTSFAREQRQDAVGFAQLPPA